MIPHSSRKTFILFITLFTLMISAKAEVTFNIKCSAPDLNYLNRFTIEQELKAYENSNGDFKVFGAELNPSLTKAGNEAQTLQTSAILSGTIIKVESRFTKKPFYSVKLTNATKETTALLNLDYPGALSSSFRDRDGRVYKSKCILKRLESCLFGETIHQTLNTSDFTVVNLGQELKIIPDFSEDDIPVNTKKVSLTHKNGGKFIAWYTFQDEVDGGNTFGVIEDMSGNAVATIADSDIYSCKTSR